MTTQATQAQGGTAATGELALAGLRVIGLTNVLSGPFLEQLFADMGAEVIRVERPGQGDDSRHIPPLLDGVSLTYLIANRNKKSVTLDLRHPRGVELLKRLIAQADVVMENSRPGVLERLGLGYQTMREVNERIVLTSISGFGQTGPKAKDAGYNPTAQAASGFMSVTGFHDGPPLRTAAMIGDFLASLYAAFGTLVALRHRDRTGQGQWVDASLYESLIPMLGTAFQEYLTLGTVRRRTGNWAPTMAPNNAYPAADGDIVICIGNEGQWKRLCALMQRGELAEDPRFSTGAARVKNVTLVDELVREWTSRYDVDAVIELLRQADLPCSPVNTIDRVVRDPQTVARNLIETVEHPLLGPLKMLGVLPKLSLTPGRVMSPPPELGQHNAEVYGGLLGLSSAELAELKEQAVI